MQLDDSQIAAIENATSNPISIITGGAGSGKTTIIKQIAAALESENKNVELCAFAGKAAARIREACQHPASTIHRMLGYNGKGYTRDNLHGANIIIDESSMIDSLLLAEITNRKPRRLCLVGDPAQLPPVGRGQPFHDLINYRPDLVSELTTCYRATEAVYQAASTIREGGRPPMSATSPEERWTMKNTGNHAQTQMKILEWINAGDVFDFDQDVIICARNGKSDEDPCTVRGLNAAIVDLISPRCVGQKFNIGDRVMNTKNLPDIDVWNGTTGAVHAIDTDGSIWVRTDTPVIDYGKTDDPAKPILTDFVLFAKDNRKNLVLAYVMTVHKSQGSQYRRVMMACFNSDGWGLLDRSLLYTAVTRTKESCCVVGEVSAVWAAIDNVSSKDTIIQKIAEDE